MILTQRLGNNIGLLFIISFLFSLFFLSCKTSKIVTLATKQEIYDTLIAFGYKNKTLNYGYLMWGGFEFDSSLTEIPKLAKPYPEYKLISFNHFKNQERVSYLYYFTSLTQMLVFALPLEDNPKDLLIKRKKQIKGRKYYIISDSVYLQDKHPMYSLQYQKKIKKDTAYYYEFYVKAPNHTLRFLFFRLSSMAYDPSIKGYGSNSGIPMMMKSFHWLGEKDFYDFLKNIKR